MPELTDDDVECVFYAALGAGDVEGVRHAVTSLAIRDPRRAQQLLDRAKTTLSVADQLRDAPPAAVEAVAVGDAKLDALVDAFRVAKATAGFAAAVSDLLAVLNDTAPAVVASMMAAAVVRGEAHRGQRPDTEA